VAANPQDPFDVLVAWQAQKRTLDAGKAPALKAKLRIPEPQPLTLLALDEQSSLPEGRSALAIGFAESAEVGSARLWGVFGGRLRAAFAERGIEDGLVLFAKAAPETTLPKAVAAAKPVGLHALAPWDPNTRAKPACGGITERDPRKRCDGVLESNVSDILDTTIRRGSPVYAFTLWTEATYRGTYVTAIQVTAEGDVRVLGTSRIAGPEVMGLPSNDTMAQL
jgi:hypothetical protein